MKPKYLAAYVFLFVIVAFMLSVPCVYAARKIDKLNSPPEEPKTQIIDWEKMYPFDEGPAPRKEPKEQEPFLKRLYKQIKARSGEYTSSGLMGYQLIVDAAKKYEDIVNWNMVSVFEYNAVVKLRGGYLTTFFANRDVTQNAESVIGLAEFCRDRDIEFMYMNLPTKICISEDANISGKLDFTNQNADSLLAMLDDSGVSNYDFRKFLHEDGMNHHEAFYVTDHHWKAETGLWAARHVLEILRDAYGWDVRPETLAPANFEYVVYPKWFLGSAGKKVRLSRTRPDDFTMIYPKFETSMKLEIPSEAINISGDFSVIYNMERVASKDYYNANPYGAYGYGDKPLIRFENMKSTNSKKLLIVHDSFGNSVVPFVALGVQSIYTLDLRHFTGSLRNFIGQCRPDAVIVMYYAQNLHPVEFDSHKNCFDFR